MVVGNFIMGEVAAGAGTFVAGDAGFVAVGIVAEVGAGDFVADVAAVADVADGGASGVGVGSTTVASTNVGGMVASSTGSVGTEGSSSIELGEDPPFPELTPPLPPPLELPEPEFVEPLFEAAAGSVVVVPKRTRIMNAAKRLAHPLRSRC